MGSTQQTQREVPSGPTDRWLLVSDLDGTLTGDDAALARFVEAARGTPGLLVAINSSRPLASVDQTLAGFPGGYVPDAVIGAMGSQIRIDGELLADWPGDVGDWDRQKVDRALRGLGLEPHARELQAEHKVSYAVPAAMQQEAERAVRASGCEVQIVVSGASDFDVLPVSVGKAAAVRRLLEHYALPEGALIVAGDSGNDLAMFEMAERGIVVGNARGELREAVDRQRAYLARHTAAGGVHEGLAHWGVPIADVPRS